MRFVVFALAFCGLTGRLAAQEGGLRMVEPDSVVRFAAAAAWGVHPEDVVLDWGTSGTPAVEAVAVELVGSGAGGTWVARISAPDGRVVAQRVRAGTEVSRTVAARRLPRGTELGEADLESHATLEWGPPGEARPATLVGWVTQRVVDKGDALVEPAIRAPRAVSPGARVALRARQGSVRLEVPAVAAGSGAVGDPIYVRTETGRRIRGVVAGPGVVDVTDNLQGSSR